MKLKKTTIIEYTWVIYLIFVLAFSSAPYFQMISIILIPVFTVFFMTGATIKRNSLFAGKWYLYFVIYIIISFTWAVFKDTSSGVFEVIIRNVPYIICLDLYCNSKKNTDRMIDIMLIAITLFAVYLIAITPVSTWGTLSVGDAIGQQRNFIGQVGALAAVIGYVLLLNNRKKIYLVPIVLGYFIAIISGSRKAFVMFPIGVVLYLLTEKSAKKKVRYLLILALIGLLFLFVYSSSAFMQEIFGTRMLALFDDSIVDKSIMDREYLGAVALQMFKEKPILGWGCDNVRSYLISIGFKLEVYAHNNYLELMADYGIVGLVLYYSFYVKAIYQAIKNGLDDKYDKLIFVVLLVCMVMEYGSVNYQRNTYLYIIAIVCSSLKWNKQQNYSQKSFGNPLQIPIIRKNKNF